MSSDATAPMERHSDPRADGATKLTTGEFAQACAAGRVRQAFAREIPSGFALVLFLYDANGLYVLCTSGRLVRQWSQLNTLAKFLHRHRYAPSEFTVLLSRAAANEAIATKES